MRKGVSFGKGPTGASSQPEEGSFGRLAKAHTRSFADNSTILASAAEPPPPLLPQGSIHDAERSRRENVYRAGHHGERERKWCGKIHWVIDPRHTQWVAYWDLVTGAALFYVALVTPVEVAFLEQPEGMAARWVDPLFLCNRLVDLVFIFDLFLQFRIAYKSESAKEGTRWHTAPREIARHYLTSKWFPIDVFSVCTSIFDVAPLGGVGDLFALRIVRVLRLTKLVRLARSSRIFKAWEMRVSINYAYLSMMTTMMLILVGCHWIACAWGLQASFAPLRSWPVQKGHCVPWGDPDEAVATRMLGTNCSANGDGGHDTRHRCNIGDCEGGVCVDGFSCVSPGLMYTYSLYFAVMTITSVGYGDVTAMPFNELEQVVASVIMLASGMLWGYLIGDCLGLDCPDCFRHAVGLPDRYLLRARDCF